MSLKATSLLIEAAPLPSTFKGTPNDLFTAMIQRMKVMSPNSSNFIFVGDSEPSTDVGPWLRNGTQWWVFDKTQGRYVPLDISASAGVPFFIGNSTPNGVTPPVWLKTTNDSTDQNPNGFGAPISWLFWNGSAWVPYNSVVFSGPTTSRPATPDNFQMFYDTDQIVLIWWERGAWRTVDGVPGDLKFVSTLLLDDALARNPGWDVYGRGNTDVRGRALVGATQDPGGSPTNSFPPDSGIPAKVAGTFGGENVLLQLQPASQTSQTPTLNLWLLVKS